MPSLRKQPAHNIFIPKVLSIVIIWLLGFFWFVEKVPVEPLKFDQNSPQAEAVIVLTGGKQRIDAGIKLLLEKKAKKMLISGVPASTTLKDLLQQNTELTPVQLQSLQPAITLGNLATDTASNALEAEIWTKMQGIHSFYLVTGNYHMKRSLAEFKRVMPDQTIIPYPIIVDTVMLERLLQFPRSLWLLTVEYNKFIALSLKLLIDKWITLFR